MYINISFPDLTRVEATEATELVNQISVACEKDSEKHPLKILLR